MKKSSIRRMAAAGAVVALLGLVGPAAGESYMKVANPPDVDKPDRDGNGSWPDAGDNSCWLASAANLLSAGGWGDAGGIYNTLVGHYGYAGGGLQGQALSWYVGSQENPGALYTEVTAHDGGAWNDNWNPAFIGAELRRCQFVAIGIWRDPAFSTLGHALSVWGDDGNIGHFTDSDRDAGGTDVDSYTWGSVEHGGHTYWYLTDYYGAGQHGYLGYVATLCIPEPLTMLGVAVGLAGLAGYVRRRMKARIWRLCRSAAVKV